MGNIIRTDVEEARAISQELRTGGGAFLGQRRGIIALSLVASGAMGLITLYQVGLIRHLPEPPLKYLDADKVDAEPEAYQWLATPDAAIGLAGYSGTVVLAGMGGKDRAHNAPWIPLLMAAKLAADVLASGKLTLDQWTRHRAFCFWCLLAAAMTCVSALLAIPETTAAWRQWRAGE